MEMNVHEKLSILKKQKEIYSESARIFLRIYRLIDEEEAKELVLKEMMDYDSAAYELEKEIQRLAELYEITDFFEEEEENE